MFRITSILPPATTLNEKGQKSFWEVTNKGYYILVPAIILISLFGIRPNNLLAESGPNITLSHSAGSSTPPNVQRWKRYSYILSQQVAASLNDFNRRYPEVRKTLFRATLKFWVNQEGRLTQIEFTKHMEDKYGEQLIRDRLIKTVQLDHSPPPDLPMPIWLSFEPSTHW